MFLSYIIPYPYISWIDIESICFSDTIPFLYIYKSALSFLVPFHFLLCLRQSPLSLQFLVEIPFALLISFHVLYFIDWIHIPFLYVLYSECTFLSYKSPFSVLVPFHFLYYSLERVHCPLLCYSISLHFLVKSPFSSLIPFHFLIFLGQSPFSYTIPFLYIS